MNIKNKINSVESATIGLSFLGTIAAIVTQQVAYVATPLTLSLSLCVINKQKELIKINRQLVNLEQQLTIEIKATSQQSQAAIDSIKALPLAPKASDLDELAANINVNREELKQLKNMLTELEQRSENLHPFLKEIDITKDSLKQLSLEFSNFQQGLEQDRDSTRVTLLETTPDLDRIAQLKSSIGQQIDPELSEKIELFITDIKQRIQCLEANSRVVENSIQKIDWRFVELQKEFTSRPELVKIDRIDRSSIEMGKKIEHISQELCKTTIDHSLKLTEIELDRYNIQASIEASNQQIQLELDNRIGIGLIERVNDLDTSLRDLHDYNLNLTNRINDYTQHEILEIINTAIIEQNIASLIQQEIEHSSQAQFDVIKQILPKQYSYELVSGRDESRKIFIEALVQSQQRLILVCPWLTNYAIDNEIKNMLVAALNRGVSIAIGWGHLSDVENKTDRLSKENLLKSKARKWGGYGAVESMYKLQDNSKGLLTFKILGTHEKFLVCDRKFAMIGSHNYMTSNNSSNERELGLKTDSPETIDNLIELFDRLEA
jgi:PLD-like domain